MKFSIIKNLKMCTREVSNISNIQSPDNDKDDDSLEYIETEPVLAYSRMKNDIIEIIEKDSVSCIRSDHKVNL